MMATVLLFVFGCFTLPFMVGCEDSALDHKKLVSNGESIISVVKKLGPPSHKLEFKLIPQEATEFRAEVYNAYKGVIDKENVLIKEYRWDYKKDKLTVWFHKIKSHYVLLHSISWHKDVLY